MAIVTPSPRIGKYAPPRPRPADSEKKPRNARWHTVSEIEAGDMVMAAKARPKAKAIAKRRIKDKPLVVGLINRG